MNYTPNFDPDLKFNKLLNAPMVYAAQSIASINDEPLTYKQAMTEPYVDQWKGDGDTEINSLREMSTFVIIKRSSVPKNAKILSIKMIYKLNKDSNDNILLREVVPTLLYFEYKLA